MSRQLKVWDFSLTNITDIILDFGQSVDWIVHLEDICIDVRSLSLSVKFLPSRHGSTYDLRATGNWM